MSYTRLWAIFQPKLLPLVGWRVGVGVAGLMLLLIGSYNNAMAAGAGKADFMAKPAPSMTSQFTDQDGNSVQIADFKGAPVLVNFWATWCAPCVAELPALNRAAMRLANQNMKVLVISIDRGGAAKAGPFLDNYDVNIPVRGFDPKARLSREMGVRGLPTSFVLSADQKTAWEFIGPFEWDQDALLDRIISLPLAE